MGRTAAGKARASVKTMRASVKTAAFTHRSFAIVRVSAKEQQELAMCWRWDRVSRTNGSAKVIDTRTEGSKGLGHSSVGDLEKRRFNEHEVGLANKGSPKSGHAVVASPKASAP